MDALNIPAKFELRSFMHLWDNRGYLKKLRSPWIRQRSFFSQILKGLLFAWTLWIYLPNLNFVALPVPEIIRGTGKIWAVPGYAHAPYTLKFLKAVKNLGEKGAWAYSETSQIFSVPPIIWRTRKATKFKFGRYIHRVHSSKSLLKICEKRERGRMQEVDSQ